MKKLITKNNKLRTRLYSSKMVPLPLLYYVFGSIWTKCIRVDKLDEKVPLILSHHQSASIGYLGQDHRKTSRKTGIVAGIIVVLAAIVTITLIVVLTKSKESDFYKAAVVTNGFGCAEIGTAILRKGGNAVDAAIAALFCEGVSMPQSMGLGGGFFMTIYNRTTNETWFLDARETAPSKANQSMFETNPNLASKGALSVAVPGELRGYWRLYKKFGGGVPWKDLVQPTIDLCKNGIYVTRFLDSVFKGEKELLYADPVLRESFIDPATNETLREGQYVKRQRMAHTLEIIAKEGGDALHNGSLLHSFIKDIVNSGGILTVEDMQNYEPEWIAPLKVELPRNYSLHTVSVPGSGAILAYILNLFSIEHFPELFTVPTFHYIVESFKFGYGARTQLGDPHFNDTMYEFVENLISKEYAQDTRSRISLNMTHQDPQYYGAHFSSTEDHGTANLEVISAEGDVVSVTSTINLIFGAGFASESTGIILNDEMDDFSSPNITNSFGLPPSPINFIKPGKRPMSSMCPSIITDGNGDAVLAIGAAGGSKITTAVAMTIISHLWYGIDIKSAVDRRRLHHQLFPMDIIYEQEFDSDPEGKAIIDGLSKIGHKYYFSEDNGFAAVTAISRSPEGFTAAYDWRRSGSISYIK